MKQVLERMKSLTTRRLSIPLIGFILLFAVAYVMKQLTPNRDEAKLKECERILVAIPLYPGSEERHNSWTSKVSLASVGKYYDSDASYEELKRHYIENLTRLGWQFVHERQLFDWGRDMGGREMSFRKGEFSVVIEYAGEKADYGWKYTINVLWHYG